MMNADNESLLIDDECPICFEFLNTSDIAVLDCNHKYHLKCLYKWYRKKGSNYKCPECYVQRDINKIISKRTKKTNKHFNRICKFIKKCLHS